MPYLTQQRREELVNGADPDTSGDINYLVCLLMQDFVVRKGLSYANLAEVISGVQEAIAEFRRRIVGPYEDLAIKRNGEVFVELLDELDRQVIMFNASRKISR